MNLGKGEKVKNNNLKFKSWFFLDKDQVFHKAKSILSFGI